MQTNGDQLSPAPDEQPQPINYEARFVAAMKRRREERGHTQGSLAANLLIMESLSLDATAITRIERGDRRVRLNEAVAIAHVLGLDLNLALGPGLDQSPDDLLREAQKQADEAVTTADFWNAERERRRQRVEQIKAMLGNGHGVDHQAP